MFKAAVSAVSFLDSKIRRLVTVLLSRRKVISRRPESYSAFDENHRGFLIVFCVTEEKIACANLVVVLFFLFLFGFVLLQETADAA